MDKADQLMNADRPIVQESTAYENCVELHLPAEDRVVVMDYQTAMEVFSDFMRIVTGLDPDEQPEVGPGDDHR